MNRRAARLEPEHQAQQYLWSGIALKRFGAKRYIWALPLAASPGLRGEQPASSAAISLVEYCAEAVWSEATHLATSIGSEPDSRSELPASSAEQFRFKSCSQAVWSAATHLATSISSEPDLRGELPATSAAISLVGYCAEAVWSEAT